MSDKRANTYLILCFVSLLVGGFGISVNSGSGGYEDIYIIIQDSVAENEELINRIQETFTNASQLLFEATKHQVYFRKINIIIPKDWTFKQKYTIIPARSELETYINVENGRIKRPHTKPKRAKCGLQMRYIYLHQDFLLTEGKTKWGYHANVVVHEWGHLRWGLFDEYANLKFSKFYMKDGEWKPTRCSESVSGKVGKGSKCNRGASECDTSNTKKTINETCKLCPDKTQNFDGLGSIMAYNWVDGVSMFCDNPDNESVPIHQRHNRDATNKHNTRCNHRSAWEVMRDHDDFQTEPLPTTTNTTPEFRLLQESNCYRVLVLDVSGSMTVSRRIQIQNQSSAYIIKTLFPENSWLGIIVFSSSATVTKNMVQVTSQAVRNDLINGLPTTAGGATCIGCGIEAAVSMLSAQLHDPAGSEIIVISDGQNNINTINGDLDASVKIAIDAQVTIHTLSVSQNADTRLISMATDTGGIHVPYLETGNMSFTSAFIRVLPCGVTSYASESTTLLSEKLDSSLTEVAFTFDIDSSVGIDTTVSVLLDSNTSINIEVSGPDGAIHTEQTYGNGIVLVLPDTAVAGQYNATVKTSSATTFEYYVTSMPKDSEVLRVSSFVSPTNLNYLNGELPVIYADVIKGRAPVLGAIVTAIVETGSISCDLTLLDNGADPDDSANDGTYSVVIPRECLSNGRIATKVYARGEKGTALVLTDFSGAGSLDSDEDLDNTETLETSFQRVTVSNEILVTDFVDQDIIAPGRITDVNIVDIFTVQTQFGESRNFTITWTATGDDVNIGQAMEYELRISNDQSVLSTDFSNADLLDVVNTNFTPKAAGTTESVRIEVDAEESYVSTAYFGVRAKDDAGNVGPVSNIVSIVVANGYRVTVEGDVDVVYSNTDDSVEESIIEEEKKKNLLLLAIGLSSAVACIIIAITAVSCFVKKLKSKEIVEDSEFNSRTSITTVSAMDKPLKDFFTTGAARQTVAKKTFQSTQLPTIPEREQTWALSFTSRPGSSRPGSAISFPRKPFDIVSQGECSIEMRMDNNEAFSEQMDESFGEDSDDLPGQYPLSSTNNDFNEKMTRESNMTPNTPEILEAAHPICSPTKDDFGPTKVSLPVKLNTLEKHDYVAVNETKKMSKRGNNVELFAEGSVSCADMSLKLPAVDNDELNNEIKRHYEEMC